MERTTTQKPTADAVAAAFADQRNSMRMRLGARGTVIHIASSSDEPLQVTIHNVSDSGISVFCAMPMKVGDQFHIQLPTLPGKPHRIGCKVVRCDPHGKADGAAAYVVGASFTTVI
jgi:hypothetical protein